MDLANVVTTAVYDSAKGGIQYVFFDIAYHGMDFYVHKD